MDATRRRHARRRILSWIPISVVALICAGFVVGAVTMQDSWWTDPEPTAAADQRTPKGMSMFTGTGVDYLSREGFVRIELRDSAEPATTLGLDADGTRTITPIVPVDTLILAEDGVLDLDLVREIVIETADDAVSAVHLRTDNDGAWTGAYAEVASVASDWGYTAADLAKLRDTLTDRAQAADGDAYAAALDPRTHLGAAVSAEIAVDQRAASVTATFTMRP
jgi:hypothetical protein